MDGRHTCCHKCGQRRLLSNVAKSAKFEFPSYDVIVFFSLLHVLKVHFSITFTNVNHNYNAL